jgi:hypothetical protein
MMFKKTSGTLPGYEATTQKFPIFGNICFKAIRIDSERTDVAGISYWGINGLDGRSASGCYFPNSNEIQIGGKVQAGFMVQTRTQNQVIATMIHELTHFIACEIYGNECDPYSPNDDSTKETFKIITADLQQRQNSLDSIISSVFVGYEEKYYHSEFIVRVPQMIVEYLDGLERIRRQAPALFNHYSNVFLPAVIKHIEKLEKRALSNWPIEMFPMSQSSYSLHRQ